MIPLVTARMLRLQWFPCVAASLARFPNIDDGPTPFVPLTPREAHCVSLAARLVSPFDASLPLDVDAFAGLDRLDRDELDETPPLARVWSLRTLVTGKAA